MHAHICTNTHLQTHPYTNTHTQRHTCTNTNTRTCRNTHMQRHSCTNTQSQTHACTNTHSERHAHTCRNKHVYRHACTNTHSETHACTHNMRKHTLRDTHANTLVKEHTHTDTHTHTKKPTEGLLTCLLTFPLSGSYLIKEICERVGPAHAHPYTNPLACRHCLFVHVSPYALISRPDKRHGFYTSSLWPHAPPGTVGEGAHGVCSS